MYTEQDYTLIAQAALKHYDCTSGQLDYLGKSDSVTFRVRTLAENPDILLKLHYSEGERRTRDSIESELIWLEALSCDTKLTVPTPVRNLEQELVTVISYGTLEQLSVTCCRWVDGELLDREPSPEEVTQLAQLMSALHQHAKQWETPAGFVRPVYHRENLLSSLTSLQRHLPSALLSAEQFNQLGAAANRIIEVITKQPLTRDSYGIIHSDLHESNYVFYDGEPRPIDFSGCGYGFYLFDVAETFLHLSPVNRRTFISVYAQHNELPPDYESLLESYFIWAILRNFAFHSANPLEHEGLSRTIPYVIERFCSKYLQGEPYLLI